MIRRRHWLALLLALLASPAFAQQRPAPAAPAPANWEQLSPAERDTLIAPIRDRWNSADADHRQRMLDHARRWMTMTPAQREAAHKGMRRWDHLSPDQRDQARELFERMRSMPPDERRALKDQWHGMTPEQRKAWLDAHPPKD